MTIAPARTHAPGREAGARLRALAALAGRAAATAVAGEAGAVAARIGDGLVHVACVGPLERGESTFPNARGRSCGERARLARRRAAPPSSEAPQFASSPLAADGPMLEAS